MLRISGALALIINFYQLFVGILPYFYHCMLYLFMYLLL